MKKDLFLFLLLTLLVFQFNLSLRAQIFSEAPVTISDKGERLSKMIYIKFRPGNLIEIPKDRKDVDGNSISNKFSNIRKIIFDFCKNWKLDLPDLKISKAIPKAKDDDTLFTDVKTGEIKKLPNLARVFIIEFPKQVDVEAITTELSKHKEIEYAHGPIQLVNCAEYPNDQYYANGGQWYLNTISAPEAWGITKGGTDIKIALIETSGVELTHSDLQSKIAGGDNNPAGILAGHGTNVAGFAGAVTNNSTPGVASLGWNIKLLTYQPPELDDDYRNGLAQKIIDAADAGAHVINLSFKTIKYGFTSCSLLLKSNGTNNSTLAHTYYYNWPYGLVEDAITYAVGKNAVVVAAAGNTNNAIFDVLPCESIPYPCYPAQYSNVIAVSGSQQNNNFVDGWNYGSFIDVNAPGRTDVNTGLWSTDLNNSYTNDISKTSGTSFSTPQVSALCALIKSINDLSPSVIESIIKQTGDKIGTDPYTNGWNQYLGYGRINAYNALLLTHAYNNMSITQTATAKNNQRKLVQDGSGNYHVVFSSGGEIFYRKNISGTWQDPVKISYVNGSNDYPSIVLGPSAAVMIVWQRNTSSGYYDIDFSMSTDGGSTWSSSYRYTLEMSVASSVDPTPVITMNSSYRKTILFSSSSGLKSKTSTSYYPTQNDWTSQSITNSSYDQLPTLATSGNSTNQLQANQNTSDNHVYYRYQDGSGNWSSATNLSSIIPGTAVHQTPSITGVPTSGEVHVAWKMLTSGGSSTYDHKIIHRKKSSADGSWPNEYATTYYEGQQLPSISGLATNKVDIVFQLIPGIGNTIYKMRFNGSYWGGPTSVAENSVYPSVSIGSTTAKYVYTNGTSSPYTVTLSSETLSKEREFKPEVYSRSIAIMNNPEEYLEVVLNKMFFKTKDGSKQIIDFESVSLDTFKLTIENAFDLMQSVKDITIPADADELVFDYKIRGENLDKVINGNKNKINLTFSLDVDSKSKKMNTQSSVDVNNGIIEETKQEIVIPLCTLNLERGYDKIKVGMKLDKLNAKETTFASLGHIFDFNGAVDSKNLPKEQAIKTNSEVPTSFDLQNYPNPFNPTTKISFSIPQKSQIKLKVFDVLGREVANLAEGVYEGGKYEVTFDANKLPSGVYFYNLTIGSNSISKKMLLVK
ncbi:MAG: S8/S53 family peptidase [Melioribacteraceae bacterium]|nr:S8/S53 family peptidase [Melioribacteraceae bacterium]